MSSREDLFSSGTPEEQLLTKPTKNPKPIKTKTTIKNGETCVIPTYRNGCKSSEKILWMIEFLNTETHTPVLLMNYLQSTPARSADLGKHSVFFFFLINSRKTERARSARGQNHKSPVQKTPWWSRAPCRKFLVTWQDLTTQWIQSYPCKTKTSQETQRSLQKVLEPNRKPKVIYTDR